MAFSKGFRVLIGMRIEDYVPRTPMMFYPPEGTATQMTDDPATGRRCLWCKRLTVTTDASGMVVFTMCCSPRCYRRLRGIDDERGPRARYERR